VAFEGSLKVLRDAAAVAALAAQVEKSKQGRSKAAKAAKAAAARAAAAKEEDEEMEEGDELFAAVEDGTALEPGAARTGAAAILAGLHSALAAFPLRDQPEALKQAVEALCAVAAAPPSLGLSPPSLAALRALLAPAHGDVLSSAAAQMQRLSPVLLGSSGRGSAGAAVLDYLRELVSDTAAARPAAAALVRHLCLRCGDKADARARVRAPRVFSNNGAHAPHSRPRRPPTRPPRSSPRSRAARPRPSPPSWAS
jgi:hypothetical protein